MKDDKIKVRKPTFRYGTNEWWNEHNKELKKDKKALKNQELYQTLMNMKLKDLEGFPVYERLVKLGYDTEMMIKEIRMNELLRKGLVEGSMKALELSFKLDGSLSDITIDVNFEEIEEETEGIA